MEQGDGDVKINLKGKKRWILLAFVLGVIAGIIFMKLSYTNTPDEVVGSFERFMLLVPQVRPGLVNDQTTIKQATDLYFRYSFYSRALFANEISKMCGEWDIDYLNKYDLSVANESLKLFCSEVCR